LTETERDRIRRLRGALKAWQAERGGKKNRGKARRSETFRYAQELGLKIEEAPR
jgi:hypothetical protein